MNLSQSQIVRQYLARYEAVMVLFYRRRSRNLPYKRLDTPAMVDARDRAYLYLDLALIHIQESNGRR